jgi:hypothetical protein
MNFRRLVNLAAALIVFGLMSYFYICAAQILTDQRQEILRSAE